MDRSSRVAELVRDRDKHRCKNCQSSENLEVHHIVPISVGGNDIMGNMITLCKNCHLKAHKQVKGAPKGERNSKQIKIKPDKKLCKGCHENIDLTIDKCPNCYHRDFAIGSVYTY